MVDEEKLCHFLGQLLDQIHDIAVDGMEDYSEEWYKSFWNQDMKPLYAMLDEACERERETEEEEEE